MATFFRNRVIKSIFTTMLDGHFFINGNFPVRLKITFFHGNLLIFDMQQKPAASKKASKAKNVFENIAENNVWGDPESISGSGSTVEANKYRVKFLSKFMKTHQLTRIYWR